MGYDDGGFGILEPLVAKLLEYNLFCVNITTGKKDGESFTLLNFFGGQWVKILGSGLFECSNTQLFALLQNLFQVVMIVPLVSAPEFLQAVQGGTVDGTHEGTVARVTERAPVNKLTPIK